MFSKLISSGVSCVGRSLWGRASHDLVSRGSAFGAAALEQPGAYNEQHNFKLRMFASNYTAHVKPTVVGIDLGTTNSSVAVMEGGRPVVIEDEGGRTSVPSLVHFAKDGRTLVGAEAKRADRSDPENTFSNSKRLIGRRFNEQAVLDLSAVDPTGIIPSESGEAWMTDGEGRSFSPAEVSAFVLTRLKRTAELYLNQEVGQAVIAVPANFNDSQRQATKQAAMTAGLDVLRVINEPTAAALAYGLGELENPLEDHFGHRLEPKLTAVYDLGGGTFDVSLLHVEDGVLQVRSTCGDPLLGGEDFDSVLTEKILSKLGEHQGMLTRCNRAVMRGIREAAERAKMELSVEEQTTITLPLLTDQNEPLSFDLSRREYEKMVRHLVQRTVPACQRAMAEAAVTESDVGKVLLVGGMTRMPLVRETAAGIFGREPITGTELSPDEAVAAGAAVQGAILTGELSDMLLMDVATMSLGIEVFAGTIQKVIVKNTALPAHFTQVIHNAAHPPNKMLEVNLYQGEEEVAEKSTLLARLKLPYVPSIELGLARTELTFRIDVDGVVSVSATDYDTGRPQHVDVDPYARGVVGQGELQDFLGAAEEQCDLNRDQIDHIKLVNSAELFITDTERAIRLFLRQLPTEDAAGVLQEITELREILDEIKDRDDIFQYLKDFESSDRIRNKFEAAKQKSLDLFSKAAQEQNKNKE